jgi:hypothetical protein
MDLVCYCSIHCSFHKYVAESYLEYTEAVKLHARWLTSYNSSEFGLDERIARLYMSALTDMSSKLADSLITFDIPSLVIASGILWQVCHFN